MRRSFRLIQRRGFLSTIEVEFFCLFRSDIKCINWRKLVQMKLEKYKQIKGFILETETHRDFFIISFSFNTNNTFFYPFISFVNQSFK